MDTQTQSLCCLLGGGGRRQKDPHKFEAILAYLARPRATRAIAWDFLKVTKENKPSGLGIRMNPEIFALRMLRQA